jgi:hypothetical protein
MDGVRIWLDQIQMGYSTKYADLFERYGGQIRLAFSCPVVLSCSVLSCSVLSSLSCLVFVLVNLNSNRSPDLTLT